MDNTSLDLINNIYVQGGAVMLVVNGAISILKKWIPSKFLPLIALGLPVVAGLTYGLIQHLPVVDVIVKGFIVGASSMGAYDVVKKATDQPSS